MPYTSIAELPPRARDLPPHAQEIFLAAFNHAWRSYAERGPHEQEEIAFRIAWSAVKKQYTKRGVRWIPNGGRD